MWDYSIDRVAKIVWSPDVPGINSWGESTEVWGGEKRLELGNGKLGGGEGGVDGMST